MNTTLIAICALGAAIILLIIWIFILERRIKQLMAGRDARSLEDTVNANTSGLEHMYAFEKDMRDELMKIDARMKKKLHGVKTLRFNPFAGTGSGGNQSFATAFLDEEGNGAVLSSLYSREKVSVFAKPITGRKSEFELTEEEKEVLK